MLSLCPFDISVGVGDFVIGLSQISSFFVCSEGMIVLKDKLTKSYRIYDPKGHKGNIPSDSNLPVLRVF